jgi:hypothetical protein
MIWYPENLVEVETVRDWVKARLDGDDQFADGYPVAILKKLPDNDAVIRAAMIFDNCSKTNVFIAGASDTNGFMAPAEVAMVLATPFLPPLNVIRITALVSKANKRSARLMEGLGFVHEGTLRDYEKPGSHTLVYGLTKSDFLGGRYGRKAIKLFEQSNECHDDWREPFRSRICEQERGVSTRGN